ncbi:hypothetical protein ABPG74_013217 [Tetrahymena malaccensis]
MISIDSSKNNSDNYCLVCNCAQCSTGYILFNQKQCTSNCENIGDNYIYNPITNTCQCKEGFSYLVKNKANNKFDCTQGYGFGYFCDAQNQCYPCSENCSTCLNTNICQKCNQGSYLWQNFCYTNCFPSLNIVPNKETGICECPEGYIQKQLFQSQQIMCQLPLKIKIIRLINSLTVNQNASPTPEISDNLVNITFNRELTSEEYQQLQLFIDKGSLNQGKEYYITSISQEEGDIKIIIKSDKNRRISQLIVQLTEFNETYQLKNTILVSSNYEISQSSSGKQVTQKLQDMSDIFQQDQSQSSKRCQKCPNSSYLSSSNQNCSKCNYECIRCSEIDKQYSMISIDSSQNNSESYCLVCSCAQCSTGYILFNQKQCTSNCENIGDNYKYNPLTNTCQCVQGFSYLVKNKADNKFDCTQGYGYGYFCDAQNQCYPCSENCSTCSNANICQKCNQGSYLWQNFCYPNCFPSLNIVPNNETGVCECPEGYVQKQLMNLTQGQKIICQLILKIKRIRLINSLIINQNDSTTNEISDNLVIITFNRKLNSEEYQQLQFFIDKGILNQGKEYNITSTTLEEEDIKIIIKSDENRKISQIIVQLPEINEIYQLKNTILVSSNNIITESSSGKQVTQKLQDISEIFQKDQSSLEGKMINLLKSFQILSQISNFVQILPMVYLIRDSLPSKIKTASLFGVSIVFNQTPQSSLISFSAPQSSEYEELQQILQSFGISSNIYENFLQLQISYNEGKTVYLINKICYSQLLMQLHLVFFNCLNFCFMLLLDGK